MNTGNYISPDIILSSAAAMAGDRDYKVLPRGFYHALIQEAFEALALDTFFDERRESFDFPNDTLTLPLPTTCFNMKNVYLFSGDICNISSSKKVYWKRNYYTEGNGYIANDKGSHNSNDPFYDNHQLGSHYFGNLVYARLGDDVESRLFYNIQAGNIMFSSSCRGQGNKVHLHFNGSGCEIGEAPIIPIFLRTAMQDFVTEAAMRFRMANDPLNAKSWAYLQQLYEKRLKDPYEGSWAKAEYRIKTLNSSQREELKEYLGKGGWGTGF
jgi:hypothetical protein